VPAAIRGGFGPSCRWAFRRDTLASNMNTNTLMIFWLAAFGLAAASREEREPLPLEEAKALAVKFDNLRTGMSPEQVGSALGLETVAARAITYEGTVRYAGTRSLQPTAAGRRVFGGRDWCWRGFGDSLTSPVTFSAESVVYGVK
jgi:hypothetical protein